MVRWGYNPLFPLTPRRKPHNLKGSDMSDMSDTSAPRSLRDSDLLQLPPAPPVRLISVAQAISDCLQQIANCREGGNKEWEQRTEERLRRIVRNFLPSGAGWDNGTTLEETASIPGVKLVFTGGFHHMNDSGYYDGWTEHTIIVRPDFGGITLRITGRDRNDIKAYLYEMFHCALTRQIDPHGPDLTPQ